MTDSYRIIGAELSPYSVKVRSYFRFKGIPHQWVPRGPHTQEEFQKYARLPLIPLVITPEGEGLQDSTPIIERFEATHPEPRLHPSEPTLRFLSELVEEYADEWGNKAMFHYRWWREEDQQSAATRIAEMQLGREAPAEAVAGVVAAVVQRMVPRLSFVGSSEETCDQIEHSFRRQVTLLDEHLEHRPYLFGARPALADFGWWGQIYNASTDPTPGRLIREWSSNVLPWIERMQDPSVEGDFESWEQLQPTLAPILTQEVGGLFLPWSAANAGALEAGKDDLEVELEGSHFRQRPQKYHAKSLEALRDKLRRIDDRSQLEEILKAAGCLRWLESSPH